MKPYTFIQVNPDLTLIRWETQPSVADEHAYIRELTEWISKAQRPQYFLSDVRKGRLTQAGVISKLATLTKHPNWAGSTAFGGGYRSTVYVGLFQNMATSKPKDTSEILQTAEEALSYLESLKPGITQDIVWEALLT